MKSARAPGIVLGALVCFQDAFASERRTSVPMI